MWVLQVILAIGLVLVGIVTGFMIFAARIKSVGTMYLDGNGMAYIKFNDNCDRETLENARFATLKITYVNSTAAASKSGPMME